MRDRRRDAGGDLWRDGRAAVRGVRGAATGTWDGEGGVAVRGGRSRLLRTAPGAAGGRSRTNCGSALSEL